jgi:hypothetical protein
LDCLIAELKDLKTFVKSRDLITDALENRNNPDDIQRQVVILKRFNHAAFAVALYVSFEKFVVDLVKAFTRLVSLRRVPYKELPEKLRNKHLKMSAQLLRRDHAKDFHYGELDDKKIVENLFKCLSDAENYALNELAVVQHNANFHSNEVIEFFKNIGLNNIFELAYNSNKIKNWFKNVNKKFQEKDDDIKYIKKYLDDIVECRNSVAHHGDIPEELPDIETMLESVDFIDNLSSSIYDLVAGFYLNILLKSSFDHIDLRPSKDVHVAGGMNVVVDKPRQRLFVGQAMFIIDKSTNVAIYGRVQNLRVRDTDIQEVDADANAPDGVEIKLDFNIPKPFPAKMRLIALQEDLDELWSPLK